jgi:hypothetical protein
MGVAALAEVVAKVSFLRDGDGSGDGAEEQSLQL